MSDSNKAAIDGYLAWLEANQGRSPATVTKYRGYLDRLVQCYPGRELADLSSDEIEIFAGPVAVKGGLSGRSRRALVAAVRGLYRWMTRAGLLTTNPAAEVPYPKAPTRLPLPITLANAERLIWAPDLGTFAGIRDAAIFSVLIGCALRVSGLTALDEEDLVVAGDPDDRRLLLRVTEKGRKERQIPVPREAALMLQAYLGHPELKQIDRRTDNGRHVLFVSLNNRKVPPADYRGEARRLTRGAINQMILKHGRRAQIPGDQLHPHALRHLFGAELAEDDVDILVRQALMGHQDPRAAQVYSHLAARKLTRVVDRSNPLAKIRTPVSELLRSLGEG